MKFDERIGSEDDGPKMAHLKLSSVSIISQKNTGGGRTSAGSSPSASWRFEHTSPIRRVLRDEEETNVCLEHSRDDAFLDPTS